MSWNSNLHNKTALPAGLVIVPSEAYRCPRKQHCIKLKPPVYFSADGSLGAPLSIIFSETSAQQLPRLDEPDTPLFEGCSTRVTFVISIPGFRPFRVQKYLGSRHHGIPVASNRRKIFHQVAEAMEAFLQYIQHERHGTLFSENSGIRLDDLYLLEVRHVAKASFQPIFAVKEGYASRGWVHSNYPTPPQSPPVVTPETRMLSTLESHEVAYIRIPMKANLHDPYPSFLLNLTAILCRIWSSTCRQGVSPKLDLNVRLYILYSRTLVGSGLERR